MGDNKKQMDIMKEQEVEDPLKGWTKEQIKSALKAHSKKDLLVIAMQWRIKSEEYKYIYNELMMSMDIPTELNETNDDTTTEDTPH